MACDLVLFAHGGVRLVTGVGRDAEAGRVFPAGDGFRVEAVGLGAALVDEVGAEIQAPPLAGYMIKLDQRQFDLLVAAAVAALVSKRVKWPEGTRTYAANAFSAFGGSAVGLAPPAESADGGGRHVAHPPVMPGATSPCIR